MIAKTYENKNAQPRIGQGLDMFNKRFSLYGASLAKNLFISLVMAISFSPVKSFAEGAATGLATSVVGMATTNIIMNEIAAKEFLDGCKGGVAWGCVAAGLALVTVIQMAESSDSASNTKKEFSAGGGDFDVDRNNDSGGGGGGPGGGGPEAAAAYSKAKKELDNLAKNHNLKFDPKNNTLTDPKGKKHNIAALGSGKAMLDAGLITPEQAAELDAELKKMQDKAKVIAVGIASGGGGGGGSTRATASYKYEDPYANMYGNAGERANAPRTSGLTRTLASGESIGAQTDNIFEMVHRRYQQKVEEKIFVGQ